MVLVPGNSPFCIDATEVTALQYTTWAGRAADPPAGCEWDADLWPTPEPDVDAKPNHPVTGVDWCDAHAFCAAAGKRLCGAIGGGPLGFGDGIDPSLSEWMAACTKFGAHAFPYGDSVEPGRCNDVDFGTSEPIAVGGALGCEGGFAGVFDMSGNVREWDASCSSGEPAPLSSCRARGGAFVSSDADLACLSDWSVARGEAYVEIGFRCCADPLF
jgi:formylglycine-generating enzyme required for sulfatase activity